jgi:hypothetical protein
VTTKFMGMFRDPVQQTRFLSLVRGHGR